MEEQTFQSKGQLTALRIHATWIKMENVILFPFRYLAERCGRTDALKDPISHLRLAVK